jgi:hypothetical protein
MAYFLEFVYPLESIWFQSFKEEVETEEKFNRNRRSGGADWTAGVPYYKLRARWNVKLTSGLPCGMLP